MAQDDGRRIAEAYRWHRRLGNGHVSAAHCGLVVDPAAPDLWDANHADAVTASTADEIDGVLAAMETHLAHSDWRVVHADGFTPDPFLARLALDGFEERPSVIQMALAGDLTDRGAAVTLAPVESEGDWQALSRLMADDVAEGRKSGDLELDPAFAAVMTAGARKKAPHVCYHLVMREGAAVAYGALAVAPGGVGMIEDLYTRPDLRRQGIATGLIAAFVNRLRARGCDLVFLGALSTETPKGQYARLGFRPVGLARTWVRDIRVERPSR